MCATGRYRAMVVLFIDKGVSWIVAFKIELLGVRIKSATQSPAFHSGDNQNSAVVDFTNLNESIPPINTPHLPCTLGFISLVLFPGLLRRLQTVFLSIG